MQPVGAFNFADYCRARQGQNVPSITAAPSEISSEGTATTATTIAATDNDHVYKYVAMREPDPAKDAQVLFLLTQQDGRERRPMKRSTYSFP